MRVCAGACVASQLVVHAWKLLPAVAARPRRERHLPVIEKATYAAACSLSPDAPENATRRVMAKPATATTALAERVSTTVALP